MTRISARTRRAFFASALFVIDPRIASAQLTTLRRLRSRRRYSVSGPVPGEGPLLTGSDYGHNDPAEKAHLVTQMKAREDVPPRPVEKISCDNPNKFYGI